MSRDFFEDADVTIRVRISIEDNADMSKVVAISELGWRFGEMASLEWCVGVHVADALKRAILQGDRNLSDAAFAVIDCLQGDIKNDSPA